MKIECVKDKLAEVVSLAERITGKNLTLPVLGCLLLEAKKNTLTIKSTNLDLGIQIEIPVKVEKEGIVAIPGSVLNNFISNVAGDKNITLSLQDGNLSVVTTHNKTLIKALPHDDFPTIPVVKGEKTIQLSSKEFIKGLRSVWYSSAIGSLKPELSSVYIYVDDRNLVFVATDSFRLAEKKIVVKKPVEINPILIPFKNIPDIIRVLERTDMVSCSMTKNQIAFSFDSIYLTSRIVDGTFPDYRQIIPKDHKTEVVVLKQDLVSTLKIANIFADKFNKVTMTATPKDKHFQISTKNSDVGENTNTIDATVTGEETSNNFNYKYVTDCFQSIDSDSVSLEFNGPSRAVVIRPVGDSTFTYLVMPMNK